MKLCCSLVLKKASKIFAQHFSCGLSVTGDDKAVVQGDVTDDIFDLHLIQKHWRDISGPQSKGRVKCLLHNNSCL